MTQGTRRIERLLSRKQAAMFLTDLGLKMSAQTLARLFCEHKGPLCMRVGSRAMYKESDLIRYLRDQSSAPRRSSRDPLRPASADDLSIQITD